MMHELRMANKVIQVVGDRVLVRPDDSEELTKVGLVLPQSVIEKNPVQSGRVVATGPGIPLPHLGSDDQEPWTEAREKAPRYLPMQAELGDLVLFLRQQSFEVRYLDEQFVVVPNAAILLLIRGEDGLPV